MQSDLASRLREERGRLGLSQVAAAAALGMPAVTYRTYESGRSEPPISFFRKLADAGLDAAYVASGHRLAEMLDSHLDWKLVMEIAGVISTWSSRRKRPLEIDEQATYLRLTMAVASARDASSARQMLDNLLQAA